MAIQKSYSFLGQDAVTLPAEAFNRPVTIERQALLPDGTGGFSRVWQVVYRTWAHLEPWKGWETGQSGQMWPAMRTRILLRYRPSENIDASMRIVHKSHTYNIRAIWNVAGAQRIIECLGEELLSQGTLSTIPGARPDQA